MPKKPESLTISRSPLMSWSIRTLTGSMLDTFRFPSKDCIWRRMAAIIGAASPRVRISKFSVRIGSSL